jgi:hypothetical protein
MRAALFFCALVGACSFLIPALGSGCGDGLSAQGELCLSSAGTLDALGQPSAVVFGDLDQDGDLDVVVGLSTAERIAIFENLGDASFSPPRLLLTTQIPALSAGPAAVALADFDLDGDLDIAAANRDVNTVSIFQNVGFEFLLTQEITSNIDPFSLIAADLDEDGDPDLASADRGFSDDAEAATVSVFENDQGSFFAALSLFHGADSFSLAAGQLDADPGLELVVSDPPSGVVHIFRNLGGLSYDAPQALATGPLPFGVALFDAESDGDLDLAVTRDLDEVVSLFVQEDGAFSLRDELPVGPFPISLLATDINGDKDQDLLVVNNGTNSLEILLGDSDGAFAQRQEAPLGTAPFGLAAGDLNGDGALDLLVANQLTANLSLFLGAP